MRTLHSLCCIAVLSCGAACAQQPTLRPFVVGHLDAAPIKESSGIVESRRYPGVFWTHNDSGNAPVIFAVRRDGSLINQFRVDNVMFDWEDIAIDDDGHLFLGDIGNNLELRGSLGVLMLDEPDPNVPADAKQPLKPVKRWVLTFKDQKRMDCESLFVWEKHGFVIRKSADGKPTTLWRFSLSDDHPQTLEYVATMPMKAIICGADLSQDGDHLALMGSEGPFLFSGLAGDLRKVETSAPSAIRIEARTNEAICFTKDGLLGTSETRDVYFFPFTAFRNATSRPN